MYVNPYFHIFYVCRFDMKTNKMKITIELSEAEVKGLKAYLKEVDDVNANKDYIRQHIQNIVSGVLNAPQEAVSDYIKQFER